MRSSAPALKDPRLLVTTAQARPRGGEGWGAHPASPPPPSSAGAVARVPARTAPLRGSGHAGSGLARGAGAGAGHSAFQRWPARPHDAARFCLLDPQFRDYWGAKRWPRGPSRGRARAGGDAAGRMPLCRVRLRAGGQPAPVRTGTSSPALRALPSPTPPARTSVFITPQAPRALAPPVPGLGYCWALTGLWKDPRSQPGPSSEGDARFFSRSGDRGGTWGQGLSSRWTVRASVPSLPGPALDNKERR